ncbi:MAG TPA: ABC transporter ATP-binding protein [Chloroflexota bacterium]|nr:ABC transporter ATP-binding protein [Chloroflexota bacterium]
MRLPLGHQLGLLATYVRPQWPLAALLGLLLFSSTGLQLASPQVLRAFIDAATGSVDARLTPIALLFVGLALVQQALAVAATYVSERVGWTATNALRSDLAGHVLGLDLGFHKTRTPGELIERIDGDVTAMANFFSQFVIQILGSVLLLVGILVVLWREDWRAGAAITAFVLVALATMSQVRSIAVPYWRAARQASAELFGFLEERLAGTEDIRAAGAPAYVLRRLFEHTRERLRTGRRARVVASIPWGVPLGFAAIGTSVAFVVAAYLYQAAAITIGTAFLILHYTRELLAPLNRTTAQIEEFQRASAGALRVRELFDTPSALRDGPGAPVPAGALSVEFDRVSFGYGDGETVLHDLSFRLAAGATLGLLGRTGSGKTTVARLLFRLYDPAAGAVRLGGADLRHVRLCDLRGRVGMVTQDVQLFRATVRENLTFFDRAVSDDQIWDALEQLGLVEWCRALPRGLDTLLGADGGAGLSAGQAQLLAFGRVFLKQPGLVILDEASSRLDPATERLIGRTVEKLLAGPTAIVIAHRLATVQRVDQIMILEDGRIAEHGRRASLAADPSSRLAGLLRTGLEQVLV